MKQANDNLDPHKLMGIIAEAESRGVDFYNRMGKKLVGSKYKPIAIGSKMRFIKKNEIFKDLREGKNASKQI